MSGEPWADEEMETIRGSLSRWCGSPVWKRDLARALATVDALTRQVEERDAEIAALRLFALDTPERRHEWNVSKPVDAAPACGGCGGPHPFDTSIPSPTWNRVIRGAGLPDYLCTTCIVRAFVVAREGFTAELWGDAFYGEPIELRVGSVIARTAADLSTENTALRERVAQLEGALADIGTISVGGTGDDRDLLHAIGGIAGPLLASTTPTPPGEKEPDHA